MILMLNGSRNRGGQPDTFLMHTYKIYFRFYLLLLPLCLASTGMVVSAEKGRNLAPNRTRTGSRDTLVEAYHNEYLMQQLPQGSLALSLFARNRLTNDTETGQKANCANKLSRDWLSLSRRFLCNQIYPEKFIKLSAYEFNDELRPDNT
jgi:hypothetical protein